MQCTNTAASIIHSEGKAICHAAAATQAHASLVGCLGCLRQQSALKMKGINIMYNRHCEQAGNHSWQEASTQAQAKWRILPADEIN